MDGLVPESWSEEFVTESGLGFVLPADTAEGTMPMRIKDELSELILLCPSELSVKRFYQSKWYSPVRQSIDPQVFGSGFQDTYLGSCAESLQANSCISAFPRALIIQINI